MSKISKPIKTMKRRRRQFKKPLLNVDIASYESETPSNVCVTEPNNCEVNVINLNDNDNNCEEEVINLDDYDNNCEEEAINMDDYDGNLNDRESEQQIYESLLSNRFEYIPTIEYNEIFPGYNQELFSKLKNYLTNQN